MEKQKHYRSIGFLVLIYLLILVPGFSQTRDPLKWPFSKYSIWNVPIHNNATYVKAGIQDSPNFGVDEDVIILTPDVPNINVETNYADWSGKDRCPDEGPTLFSAPIPQSWIYDKTVWDGGTPNSGAAILLKDNRIIQTQPFAKCSNNFATSHYVWSADNCVLTGECIRGAHGGSGMSVIGGTIRVGEFTSGAIKHAVKINLWGRENFYKDSKGGYRWPAVTQDGGYNDPGAGNYYGGTNPEMKIGALLAIHKSVNLSSLSTNGLGLETQAGLILARALQNYGGYTVDNTAWDSYAVITEIGPNGSVRDEFKNLYGFDINIWGSLDNSAWGRDIKKIYANLYVISNNAEGNIGGGPTTDSNRRASFACDFGTAGSGAMCNNSSSTTGFNGTYEIKVRHSGKALDVKGSSTNNGAVVQQWTDNDTNAQRWIIEPLGDGYHKIRSKASGKALDVASASTSNGAKVQQWDYTGANNQRWKIEDVGGGYYKIVAKHSGKALDVGGFSSADGAAVQQWDYNGGDNQKWMLTRTSTSTSLRLLTETSDGFKNEERLVVFPVPVKNELTLKYNSPLKQKIEIGISDYTSRVVLQLRKDVQKGENDILINTSRLTNGIYLIKIPEGERGTLVKKIIVER